MKYKQYPAYKDSGWEWLGKMPAHWEVRRLKTIASVELSNVDKKSVEGQVPVELCNYVDVYYNERISNRIDFMSATATPDQARRFGLRLGDVLITKDSESWTDIAVPSVVVEELHVVLCGYHLALIRPSARELDGRFLTRAFAAIGPRDQFQISANGITRFGLSSDAIRASLFPVPPLSEQRDIAAFLDRETARIDALAAKKERLIELLQEKRIALITQAVTKGLPSARSGQATPNVPMKDSGVDWLGEIPAHWDVKRMKNVSDFVTSGSRGWAEYYSDAGSIFLRIGNLRAGEIDLDLKELQYVSPPLGDEGERTRVRPGDVLVSITALIGAVGVVPRDLPESYVNQHLALIRLRDCETNSRWLAYCLLSRVGQEQFKGRLYGGTKDGLGLEDVRLLVVLLPPLEEQESIVRLLDLESGKLDALISRIREGIKRLKDYRTALISAAVTGKIDVRDAAV